LNDTSVEQMDEDRFVRTTRFKILGKKKQLESPCGGITIRTDHEAGSYASFKLSYPSPHLGLITAHLMNAAETTVAFTNQNLNYFSEPKGALTQVLNNSIIMVEPCTEYPRYDAEANLKKIENSQYIPSFHRKHVSEALKLRGTLYETDREEYNAQLKDLDYLHWLKIEHSTTLRSSYIEDTLEQERITGGDYGLPPGPSIHDSWSLGISILTNDLGRRLWSGRHPCATYLIFECSVLESKALMDEVITYLRSIAPTNGDSDVVVIKFKAFNVTYAESKATQRTGAAYFMSKIRELKKEYNRRLFVLIDAGLQAYPAFFSGFDVVVTSFTGHVADSRFGNSKENIGWGGYFDPKRMIHVKFSQDLDLAKLCGCLVCEPVKSLRALEKEFWNFMVCRPHYALTLNGWASYAKRLVAERNVQEAKDHIGIDISNLKQLMPDN